MAVTFKAQWHSGIEPYRQVEKTLCQRVLHLIYNVISVVIPIIGLIRIIGFFLNKYMYEAVLPSSLWKQKDVDRTVKQFGWRWDSPHFKKCFNHEPFQVLTPDGVKLSGTHIRHRAGNEQTPTVIIFQPNATISKYDLWWNWMAKYSMTHNRPCNFVIFDYRGTGESEGKANNMNDLVLDADAILQYTEKHLQVKNPVVYGFSLGGATSAKALSMRFDKPSSELYPPPFRGKYINDRSFSHSAKVIRHNMHWGLGHIFIGLASLYKWELNSLEACEKIRAKKLLIYHPEDPLIPKHAVAAYALQEQNNEDCSFIQLESPYWYGEHFAPIDICIDKSTFLMADDPVMSFILDQPPALTSIAR